MKTRNIGCSTPDYYWANSEIQLTDITHIQTQTQPDWSFSLHSHPDVLELSLVLNGKGLLYCDGLSFVITAGDLVIKNPNVLHAEETDRNLPLEQICLSITGLHLQGFSANYFIPDKVCPVIKTNECFPLLKQLFLYILFICQNKPIGYQTTLQDMLKAVLSCAKHLIPSVSDLTVTQDSPVINDVIAYLNTYYYKPHSLEDLSKKFFFSPCYLTRKFKQETGYTINQYIINRRMGEAQRMLLYEKLSIKEIAAKNGYTNIQHFYTTFKKYTGYTPIEFKNLYSTFH